MRSLFIKPLFGACALLLLLHSLVPAIQAAMTVSSFSGPVTDEELDSFNDYVATLEPAVNNTSNDWVQGKSGEQTKAIGLVYLMTGQRRTLDQLLRFCDAVLSERNDVAPAPLGQREIWTGDIAPVWPNNLTAEPIYTGGEQGDPIGHLASCAYLILKDESLYNLNATNGNDYGYGATYLERAKTYLKQADIAMTGHTLPRLLDLSDNNKMYFAKDSPYKGGRAVPWNQQMMFNYAFQNLVAAHRILGDNDTLQATYKNIMAANLNWFFAGGGSETLIGPEGNPYYYFNYSVDDRLEDSNHASLDVAGFYRAYVDGTWCVTANKMIPFANLFVDIMILGNGTYAGTVAGDCRSGHSDCTTYVRSGFLLLSEFRPDAYEEMMSADLTEGKTTTSVDQFSRFLWVKNKRALSARKLGGGVD